MINSVVVCVLFRVFVLSVRSFEDRTDPHIETIQNSKNRLPSNEALNANYYDNKYIAKFDTTLE